MDIEKIATMIVNAAIKVHTALVGLLESAYQKCMAYELTKDGLSVECEVLLPITYEKVNIDAGYRIDMIVEGSALIENKTVEKLLPIHEAQLLTYLKMKNCKLGFLLNWNVPHMKNGIKRMVITCKRDSKTAAKTEDFLCVLRVLRGESLFFRV
jgi:GxxExxY protein